MPAGVVFPDISPDVFPNAFGGKSQPDEPSNNVQEDIAPIWNTMFLVPRHIKDEIVVVGNHGDAWVLGAVNPSSGTASLHEVVRGFADLWHSGWSLLRTILLASRDAEEYDPIGSTE